MADRFFEHRGFMLDVSRHYMPPEEIRKLLQAAALLKLNRMHWHLTDDQGWRIEIRKYPLLTEKGAFRGNSFFGGTPEGERNSGFYTQEEIRDLVEYAGSLDIGIIPEIEIPGHAAAMLAAYPQFGCRRGETGRWTEQVEVSGGIFPALACAGKDETLAFLEDILDEVTELFPFPAVHIGGDEALKLRWRRCPDCQRRIRENGLESEDGLQRWLLMRIGEYLAGKGRKTIVWNDALAGGPLPDWFIVQQWAGGEDRTRAFMEGGGQVIRSDTSGFYLDYCYGRIDVKHIWETPRVPAYAKRLEDGLLGVECPLWTERVAGPDRAAWQLFPRLAAVSLRMSEEENLPWEAFLEKVRAAEKELEEKTGLRGAPEELWALEPEAAAADREAEQERIYSGKAEAYERQEQRVVLLEETERLAESLGIPRAFVLKGGDSVWAEIHGEEIPGNDDGAGILIRQLMTAAESRKYGAWKEIPEEIWTDTMKCFPRFVSEHRRSYGRDGFDRYGWTTRQIGAKLFRIGELEYEMAEEEGRKEIGLHIPTDVRMEARRLNASLQAAGEFVRRYFPEWTGAPVTCESWLLSPALKELLPEGSRILKFQEAFELQETYPEDDTALEWVFYVAEGQREGLDLSRLPEDTSLQRKMKAMLLEGRKPGAGKGVLIQNVFDTF